MNKPAINHKTKERSMNQQNRGLNPTATCRPHPKAKSPNELIAEMHRSHRLEARVWLLLAFSASLLLALSFQI